MLTEADKFAVLLDGYLALAGELARTIAVEPEWDGQPLLSDELREYAAALGRNALMWALLADRALARECEYADDGGIASFSPYGATSAHPAALAAYRIGATAIAIAELDGDGDEPVTLHRFDDEDLAALLDDPDVRTFMTDHGLGVEGLKVLARVRDFIED